MSCETINVGAGTDINTTVGASMVTFISPVVLPYDDYSYVPIDSDGATLRSMAGPVMVDSVQWDFEFGPARRRRRLASPHFIHCGWCHVFLRPMATVTLAMEGRDNRRDHRWERCAKTITGGYATRDGFQWDRKYGAAAMSRRIH